jgi:hypothetical protein
MDEVIELVSGDNPNVEVLADAIGARTRSRRQSGSSDDTALLLIRFGDVAADEPVRERTPTGADATTSR